jgi:hypothetical protein
MKNPLALMVAALSGIFGGTKATGYSLRQSQWGRKTRVGHNEGICKGASYNKGMLRLHARSKKPDWGVHI